MGVAIGRPVNGITINPLEYILDENQMPRIFESKEDAIEFLKSHDLSDEYIEELTFVPESDLVAV